MFFFYVGGGGGMGGTGREQYGRKNCFIMVFYISKMAKVAIVAINKTETVL